MLAFQNILCVVEMIVYMFISRWYQKRRKDEDYDVHAVVNATYDRVLKQRELHEKGFNYDDSTLIIVEFAD